MEGRKKEEKLMLKNGFEMDLDEIINEICNFFNLEPNINRRSFKNTLHTDTYYDDAQKSLLKSGGSLKLRDGIDSIGRRNQVLIMRRRTKNPKKIKLKMYWEEAGVAVRYREDEDFTKILSALKGCFLDFDFSQILPDKILSCQTRRTAYRIEIEEDKSIVVLFDRLLYKSRGKEATDSLVKLRTASKVELTPLYQHLFEKFSDKYELMEKSRYERALDKLASAEENKDDSPG